MKKMPSSPSLTPGSDGAPKVFSVFAPKRA